MVTDHRRGISAALLLQLSIKMFRAVCFGAPCVQTGGFVTALVLRFFTLQGNTTTCTPASSPSHVHGCENQ